jgi:hypothetical protein
MHVISDTNESAFPLVSQTEVRAVSVIHSAGNAALHFWKRTPSTRARLRNERERHYTVKDTMELWVTEGSGDSIYRRLASFAHRVKDRMELWVTGGMRGLDLKTTCFFCTSATTQPTHKEGFCAVTHPILD